MPTFRGQADKTQISQLLLDLVAIESINPCLEGATDGERRLAEHVELWAQERHFSVERAYVGADRFNVLIELPGRDRARRLLFEAHLDTVPVGGMAIHPFRNAIRDGRIWGRGACDDKGSLAAMMSALELLRGSGIIPTVDILLAATVGEEHGHEGIRSLLESGFVADAGVVGEPTELQVVRCHRGNIRWRIRADGVAAHASKPDTGINAIYCMSELIARLRAHYVPALDNRLHPLVGRATLNVGKIRGGMQANIVPDQCIIDVERRLLPGDKPEQVLQSIQAVIDDLPEASGCRVEMEPPDFIEHPMDTPEGANIVQGAAAACEAIMGRAEITGVPFGTDASDLAQSNIPSVVLGPGSITEAHSAGEYVELDQVVMAAEIYAELCAGFR